MNRRKTIHREGGGPGGEDDRLSLDKMNLDGNDQGADHYDPFFKQNVFFNFLYFMQ